MSTRVREQIVFTGRVQGVGFRYKLSYLADAFRVTGWVKNEYDGSVTMEIQGNEAMIDRIIQMLDNDMYIDIHSMDSKTLPIIENERTFCVRY